MHAPYWTTTIYVHILFVSASWHYLWRSANCKALQHALASGGSPSRRAIAEALAAEAITTFLGGPECCSRIRQIYTLSRLVGHAGTRVHGGMILFLVTNGHCTRGTPTPLPTVGRKAARLVSNDARRLWPRRALLDLEVDPVDRIRRALKACHIGFELFGIERADNDAIT